MISRSDSKGSRVQPRMNLAEYFERIGYSGPSDAADLETLCRIHKQHVMSIPFENLSVHCGETITMDPEAIFHKLVRSRRGGWCCENNFLFSWVLQELGYTFTTLASRLYDNTLNRFHDMETHAVNKVDIGGVSYLADVSFGFFFQIWQPLEMVAGKEQPQESGSFCLEEDGPMWVLEKVSHRYVPGDTGAGAAICDTLNKRARRKIYGFTLVPRSSDYFLETIEWLQSSSESPFVKKSTCSLQTPTGFISFLGPSYIEVTFNYQEGEDLLQTQEITSEELLKVLQEKFGLCLPIRFTPINEKGNNFL